MAPEVVKGGSRGHDKVCEFYHLNPLSTCCEKQTNIRFHPDDNEINKTIHSNSCMKILFCCNNNLLLPHQVPYVQCNHLSYNDLI